MNRDEIIKTLRPILNLDNVKTKPVELFQNETLRPILKLQHDITLALFKQHKNYFLKQDLILPREQYERLANKFIQTNLDFKNQLIGTVIGLFTEAELEYYISERKELNKRLVQMQTRRFVDTEYS